MAVKSHSFRSKNTKQLSAKWNILYPVFLLLSSSQSFCHSGVYKLAGWKRSTPTYQSAIDCRKNQTNILHSLSRSEEPFHHFQWSPWLEAPSSFIIIIIMRRLIAVEVVCPSGFCRCVSSSQRCCRKRRLTQSAPLGRLRRLSHSIIPRAPFMRLQCPLPPAFSCQLLHRWEVHPPSPPPSAADRAERPLTAAPLCRLCAAHLLPFPPRC